jgi:alpha/beta hydrolase family protein
MSGQNLVGKDHLIFIVVISTLIISSSLIGNYGYFDITKVVYGQSDSDQKNSNTRNLINMQNIILEKVRVGDIDIAYKVFGKGDPIILFNGASDSMDAWDPSFISSVSSNHTVIAFDQRGIGNTTVGFKPYSMQQLTNDSTGLLAALKIPKAVVLEYSLDSFIAQQFAIIYPDKVSSIILVALTCGGKDGIPKPADFKKLQSDIVNKSQ